MNVTSVFDSFVNEQFVYEFYGVDNTMFCIGVEGTRAAFEAVEDPDDGYRSYLDSIAIPKSSGIFFNVPISNVRIIYVDESSRAIRGYGHSIRLFKGYRFIDVADFHTWLEIGTDYSDDWYPCFVFSYSPKRNNEHPTNL